MHRGDGTTWRRDASIAAVAIVVCLAMGLLGQPDWAWSALMSATLVWRRSHPVLFAATATSISAAHLIVDASLLLPGDLILLVGVFSVAANATERARHLGLVFGLLYIVGLGAAVLLDIGFDASAGTGLVVGLIGISMLTAWAFGLLDRRKSEALRAARHRTEMSERDAEARTRLAAYEERERISDEMHDVLAHTLTSIIVQAESGRAAAPDPGAAAVFATISTSGRSALREVRGLLSPADDHALQPTPSLDDLHDLIAGFTRVGTRIAVAVRGESRPLSPGMSLAAYRVIQESLTNAIRHGGDGPIALTLSWDHGALAVSVRNPVAPSSAHRAVQEHRGLAGMRRRCELYGGELTYARDDAFTVRAVWPLDVIVAGAAV